MARRGRRGGQGELALEEGDRGALFKRFDGFAKALLRALLGRHGEVVSPEIMQAAPPAFLGSLYTPLQADVVFHRRRGASTMFPRLLELAGLAAMWEPFSAEPGEDEVLACIEKALTYRRALGRGPERRRKRDFRLWIPVPSMSVGFREVLEDRGFAPDEAKPGVWRMPGRWHVGVIVLSELVRDLGRPDDGLLPLLLLARGSTLRYAIERLDHLDGEEIEAMWFLVESWHRSALRAPASQVDPWTREMVDIMNNMLMSARQLARVEGRQEGLQEGRQEGLQEGRQEERVELVLVALSGLEPPLEPEERARVASQIVRLSPAEVVGLIARGGEAILAELGLRRGGSGGA